MKNQGSYWNSELSQRLEFRVWQPSGELVDSLSFLGLGDDFLISCSDFSRVHWEGGPWRLQSWGVCAHGGYRSQPCNFQHPLMALTEEVKRSCHACFLGGWKGKLEAHITVTVWVLTQTCGCLDRSILLRETSISKFAPASNIMSLHPLVTHLQLKE